MMSRQLTTDLEICEVYDEDLNWECRGANAQEVRLA